MITINPKPWTVCFCWLSHLLHKCIYVRKHCYDRSLLWPTRFCTRQVTCDSQISDISGGTLACSSYINTLPLANVGKCPIRFSSNEISDLLYFGGGGIFSETWIHHFRPLNRDLHSQWSSELYFCPAWICERSVVETDTKPATHKNANE